VNAPGDGSTGLNVLLAAAFFGWLGYRLFSNVSTLSSAEIGVGERFRAIFVQVGPGVFSSLFGAIIQVYSLVHPAVLEQWGFGDSARIAAFCRFGDTRRAPDTPPRR